ncbi:uncharacterized protein LOC107368356 isoform X1 [Tetranychus urticae]|uniref:Transmembrane protein 134 n=1 Tax=Tetranychus urticae TaxID=32264 RepID=T1KY27_TETUR|nr:uncharacterized protein LOC107368356 isoform X1 [Tetranychus urticae]
MPPSLEVADNLSEQISSDNNKDQSREGLVINNSIHIQDGDFKSVPESQSSSSSKNQNSGQYTICNEINYGSCEGSSVENKTNQDEVDQAKLTFLNGGNNHKVDKDIESLTTCQSSYQRVDTCETKPRWWRHPKFKENWKIFFAAFGLLIVGIGLIAMGIVVTVLPDIDFQSYVFFIAGAICFIPGAYHVVYLYFAVTGRKGYDFHQLPLFN